MRDILPPDFHPVAISCMDAGVYFSHLAFMAETEMGRLLDVKERTGGLSTERLGGRNMHASLSPIPLGQGHDSAAVVNDKRIPVFSDGTSIARLDLMQALVPCERHSEWVPDGGRSSLWVPSRKRFRPQAAPCRPPRVAATCVSDDARVCASR